MLRMYTLAGVGVFLQRRTSKDHKQLSFNLNIHFKDLKQVEMQTCHEDEGSN